MTVCFKQIAYAYTPVLGEFPVFRVDFEINSKLQWREVQAQTAICAQQIICEELRIPFSMLN